MRATTALRYHLRSAGTMNQGAGWVLQRASTVSQAELYSFQCLRSAKSSGVKFPAFGGIGQPRLEPCLLLLSAVAAATLSLDGVLLARQGAG